MKTDSSKPTAVHDLWEYYPWVVSTVLTHDGKPDTYGQHGYCQPVNLEDGRRLGKWFFDSGEAKGLGSLGNSLRYAKDEIRFELDDED